MAGNGKDDPQQIDRVLAPVLGDEADYVQGSRFATGGVTEGLPAHRNLAIRVFTRTFSLLVGHRFTDCANGYRAYCTTLLRDDRLGLDRVLGHVVSRDAGARPDADAIGPALEAES